MECGRKSSDAIRSSVHNSRHRHLVLQLQALGEKAPTLRDDGYSGCWEVSSIFQKLMDQHGVEFVPRYHDNVCVTHATVPFGSRFTAQA